MGIGVIPIPILVDPIPTFYLILVPFPSDYHGTPIAIGIPNPMHISTIDQAGGRCAVDDIAVQWMMMYCL